MAFMSYASCSAYHESMWGQCCDLEMLELVRSIGSAILCAQRMRAADYLNIQNDWVIPSMVENARSYQAQIVKE